MQYVKDQVSSGLYCSVSELMRDALRLLREKNMDHIVYLNAMHNELNVAATEIDNGDISSLDIQQLTKQVIKNMDKERH